MWLELRIPHKFAGADSCAVDYKIEIAIDFFEFFEANLPIDFAARFPSRKSRCGIRARQERRRRSDRKRLLQRSRHALPCYDVVSAAAKRQGAAIPLGSL